MLNKLLPRPHVKHGKTRFQESPLRGRVILAMASARRWALQTYGVDMGHHQHKVPVTRSQRLQHTPRANTSDANKRFISNDIFLLMSRHLCDRLSPVVSPCQKEGRRGYFGDAVYHASRSEMLWAHFLTIADRADTIIKNAPTCYRAPRWPELEFPRKIPKKYPSGRNSGTPRKYPQKYRKDTKNAHFWYFGGIFSVFSGYFGGKFWESGISGRGVFFRYFSWKFRVGPFRGSVAGRGVLNTITSSVLVDWASTCGNKKRTQHKNRLCRESRLTDLTKKDEWCWAMQNLEQISVQRALLPESIMPI